MVSADGSRVTQDRDAEGSPNPASDQPTSPPPNQSSAESPMTPREIRKERKRMKRMAKRQAKIAKAVLPFQSDAVELEYRKVAGGARWTLYIVVLLMCTCVGWAYWAKIDKIVISQGELVPVDQPIVIQPVVSAPIKSIMVRQFDRVVKGQKLVELDPTFSDSDVEQLKSDIRKASAAISRLEKELADEPFEIPENLPEEDRADYLREFNNFLIRKSAKEAKLAEFLSTMEKLKIKNESDKELVVNYTEMKDFFVEREKREVALVKKEAINKKQLEETRLQLKRYTTEIVKVQGQQRQTSAELATTKRSIESFKAEWKATAIAEQIEAQKELDKAKQALDKAKYNKERSTIFVPDDDDIPHDEFYVIQVAERTVGSMVQAGEPLMKLMPIDAKLEAEVEIHGKDIGKLHGGVINERLREKLVSSDENKDGRITKDELPKPLKRVLERLDLNNDGAIDKEELLGVPVRVKLTSFEYQKYGYVNGRIRTISEGTVQKPGAEGQPAVSVYKARVTLDIDNSPKFIKPPNFKPLPGMAVITDINVGNRRVIEYFLYPFFKHLDSSIREP